MRTWLFIVVLFFSMPTIAQTDSSVNVQRRKTLVIAGVSGVAAGSLVYLNEAWYRPYRGSRFHFFDDNAEWLQVDKVGHAFTGFQGTRLLTDLFKWSGMKPVNASLYGAATAFGYLTAIECLDGFSTGWGFSWSDMGANLTGVLLAAGQHQLWGDQRIHLKFNYFATPLAAHNPRLLGENWYTRLLKDYNGQTYWLSFNPFVVAGKSARKYLPWLNLSFGYGAYGMTGARDNVSGEFAGPVFVRERQFYFSFDLDLSRIKTRWKPLNQVLRAINVVKIPAPAIRLTPSGTIFLIR